jgi:hypothetical protein
MEDIKQLGYTLKVDARYKIASASLEAKFNSEKTKNRYVAFFTQKFYDVSYDIPPNPIDAFAQGAQNNGDIGSNNPPIVVSEVSYGRMYFLVIETFHSKEDVNFAITAALNGKIFGGKVNGKFDMATIYNNMSVEFIALGGDAATTTQIANLGGDAQQTFNAVKALIANKKLSEASSTNLGYPIAYTLKYLKDGTTCSMGYSVDYARRQWDLKVLDSPLKIEISNLSGFLFVMRPNTNGQIDSGDYVALDSKTTANQRSFYPRTAVSAKMTLPVPGSISGLPERSSDNKERVHVIVYRENGVLSTGIGALSINARFLRTNQTTGENEEIGSFSFSEQKGKASECKYVSLSGNGSFTVPSTQASYDSWGKFESKNTDRNFLKHAFFLMDWEIDWSAMTIKCIETVPWSPDMATNNGPCVYYDTRDNTVQFWSPSGKYGMGFGGRY